MNISNTQKTIDERIQENITQYSCKEELQKLTGKERQVFEETDFTKQHSIVHLLACVYYQRFLEDLQEKFPREKRSVLAAHAGTICDTIAENFLKGN